MAVKYVYFLSFDSNQSKSAWKVSRSTLTLLLCSVSGYVSSFKLFFFFSFQIHDIYNLCQCAKNEHAVNIFYTPGLT